MALLKKKKEEKKEKVSAVKSEKVSSDNVKVGALELVLLRPRVTEKASMQAEVGAYVFEVKGDANKQNISDAIKQVYGFTPVKVNITKIPSKRVLVRGKRGVKSGGKKAYVYLKEGDSIEII